MTIITLATDFGLRDEYVGVVKGAVLAVNPRAVIVDLCHGIRPQNIAEAAYMLKASWHYFPSGTVHVAVVDPGVGTDRDIIAVQCGGHLFIAPDNGLLWPLIQRYAPEEIRRVENRSLFRQPVSRTFHGRDIFAPVAGYLANGIALETVGERMNADGVTPMEERWQVRVTNGVIHGAVVSVDRFGNLVTNIALDDIEHLDPERVAVTVARRRIEGLEMTYAGHDTETPMVLPGSRNCLEIAVNCGNAAKRLRIGSGEPVTVSAS
jgi:S-adenosylmethionine hydrolase